MTIEMNQRVRVKEPKDYGSMHLYGFIGYVVAIPCEGWYSVLDDEGHRWDVRLEEIDEVIS